SLAEVAVQIDGRHGTSLHSLVNNRADRIVSTTIAPLQLPLRHLRPTSVTPANMSLCPAEASLDNPLSDVPGVGRVGLGCADLPRPRRRDMPSLIRAGVPAVATGLAMVLCAGTAAA